MYLTKSGRCPAKNGDFDIIKHEEITDTDGTILGTALAKSKSQYATWEYCYFPKTDYFNGFNMGHYFTDELEAVNNFYMRCAARSESVLKAKSFYKEVTPEQLEKLEQSDLNFAKSVKDGQIIVKVDRSDGEKLNAMLKNNNSVKL